MKSFLFAVLWTIALSCASNAQEFALGLGASSYSDAGRDGPYFALDYRHTPFRERGVASFALGAAASVTDEGDFFVGAGISARWQWDSGWFVETSVMPGLYDEGTPENDLGSTFEVRSLLGVGYRFDNGHAISAGFTHKSNAGLASENPGMNAYTIRYHFPF